MGEVRCDGSTLLGATLSDAGHVIIAMFFDEDATKTARDTASMEQTCTDRAAQGFNSGMGVIFRKVAEITPVGNTAAPKTTAVSAGAAGTSTSPLSSSTTPTSNQDSGGQSMSEGTVSLKGSDHQPSTTNQAALLDRPAHCFTLIVASLLLVIALNL